MAKVIYEKRDQIAYITLNRPEVHNAIDTETDELLFEAWTAFPRRPRCPDRDPHRVRRQDLLRGRRPQIARRSVAQRRARTRTQPAGQGVRGPDHPRAAPNAQTDHRGAQRLGHRGRHRTGPGLRHQDRLRARELRVLPHAPRHALRRRRHRPAGQHGRCRHRDGAGADGRTHRRAAGQRGAPRQSRRAPWRSDGDRRGHRGQDSAKPQGRSRISEADHPRGRRAAPWTTSSGSSACTAIRPWVTPRSSSASRSSSNGATPTA